MPNYFVTWEIDIEEASDPVEAAKWCREMLMEPDCEALVFNVKDESTGVVHEVDLFEEGLKDRNMT